MGIKAGDVKLLASAVMDDVPEGGGAPSSHVIADNVSNEIFKDISESDRARGRFNAAKVHVSIQTEDTDTYLGANVIVGRPPEDPNVSIALFTRNDVYDTRDQAVARLEAYLNRGPEWGGLLYENHIAGQRSIQLFQRVNAEVPAVGHTLCLVLNEGLANEREQYVRAIRVTTTIRTFTYNTDQDYQAAIVTLELSDPLRYDFKGSPANRQFLAASGATKVRDTVVADAATYAGVVALAAPVTLGDFTLRATTIFTPLVPSAQVETPITATSPIAGSGTPARAQRSFTYSSTQTWTTTTALTLPGGCTPGTLSIAASGVTIVDSGGVLMVGDQQVGTIDYANGILTLSTGSYPGTKQITFEPSAYLVRMPQSYDIQVTQESRALNYVGFINPVPMPGTTTISYRAQGRWYVLSDNGSGALRGYDSSAGAGTINTTTGDFVATLGALPDVGSSIVVQWGVPTQEYSRPVTTLKASQTVPLEVAAGESMNPALLNFSWNDGTARTATTSTAGVISGDATGSVDLNLNQFAFTPNLLPPYGTEITATYDIGPRTEVMLSHPARDGGGQLPIDPGATNLVPGSVIVQWNTLTDTSVLELYTREQLLQMGITTGVDPIQTARDDGNGKLLLNGVQVGTVNYTTGAIRFQPDTTLAIPKPRYVASVASGSAGFLGDSRLWRLNYAGIEYITAPTLYPNDESGWVKVMFYAASSNTRKTTVFAYKPTFDLITGSKAPATPGSLILTTSTGTWGDSGNGVLREAQADGSMLQRGTIDYATSRVTLTSWPVGMSGTITRANLLTSLGENVSSAYVFRTAAAPIRPGSLSIQYAMAGGGTQVVTAGLDGVISATGVVGTVDYETGLVRLGFGQVVTAAGNEDQPWFDPNNVTAGGQIFKPMPVPASSVKYTTVAYSYLPLNADIVGVDPVRLPSDGRVPIFRPGTMVIIGNTKSLTGVNPTNGQTVNLARTRLSRAVVRDNTGAALYLGYTVDLEAGTVTFTDVSGMAMPLSIEHRIEDMVVAREVEISGSMTFTRQITHNYPVEGTYISSALEFGDRKARVSTVFDQATWDGVTWSDTPTSAVATASYNTVLSPIEVTNIGASSERFGLWFTSPTQFRIIGEHVGQIGTGDINTDCAPINPATGKPYFTIRTLGWGTGWANGNVLRLNTVGALAPVWVVRTVQPGMEAGIDYSFDLLTRGDVDRP